MIWPNSVTHSVYTTLNSYSTLVNSGVHFALHEPLNSDPNLTPWVGVYLNNVDIEPYRVMNGANPRLATYEIIVMCQEFSMQSGEDANDKLHRLVTPVLAALKANDTLDGTVNIIQSFTVTPYERNIGEDDILFTDQIAILAEVDA